jgi:hypothetical protein
MYPMLMQCALEVIGRVSCESLQCRVENCATLGYLDQERPRQPDTCERRGVHHVINAKIFPEYDIKSGKLVE